MGMGTVEASGVACALLVSVSALLAQEAGLLERPARLDVREASVADALSELQRASGVALAFSPDLLPSEARVTCRCADVPVRVALDRILSGTGLRYVGGRRQVLVGRLPGDGGSGEGSPETLTGVVVEEDGGRPVAAAEVGLATGGRTVLTGDDGRFALPAVGEDEPELTVVALGYAGRTVQARRGSPVRVALVRTPIPLDEIVIAPGSFGVLEVSPTVSGVRVSREDIEATPQLGDDVFRTLKRLPGVSTDDISTRLNIRGGTDRDLLVRLDGLELYEPYHLKDLDGALGIVDVQSLGGVDLVTGGFPVEFGDKTTGVFDMHTRRPPASGTRTTVGLSLSSLGANSQGSFDDGRGQWVAALRRGFLQYVLAVGGVDDDINPRYWDVLGRVQYLVSPRHVVSAEILMAGDQMRWRDENTASRVDSDWSNGYAWLTWKAEPLDRLRVETLVSVGELTRDRTGSVTAGGRGDFTPLGSEVSDLSDFHFRGLRQDWQIDLTEDLVVKSGFELRRSRGAYDYFGSSARYDVDASSNLYVRHDTTAVVERPEGDEVGAWGALRGRVRGGVTWEGGVRYDRQSWVGGGDVAPRALLRWDLARHTSLRASWGRYYESQDLHDLRVQDGERSFNPSERADQVALGFERALGDGVTARVEAYARAIHDPLPTWVNLSREVNPIPEVEADRRRVAPERARARGVELIVSRDGTGAFSWSGSYALAKAEDLLNGRWRPRTLDQRHTLTLQGAYRIGRSWQISGVWHYHSGWPFTGQTLDVRLIPTGDGTQQVEVIRRGFEDYNAERLPPYHRLDLRVTRAFELRRSRLEVFLDVFNAYDRTNLRGYEWVLRSAGGGLFRAVRDAGEEQLPIMPTLGLRWVF